MNGPTVPVVGSVRTWHPDDPVTPTARFYAKPVRPLAEANADWCRARRWDWFVTATFRTEVSTATCLRAVGDYIRAVSREHGQHVVCAVGGGEGLLGGRAHAHILMGSDRALLPRELVVRNWNCQGAGSIQVDVYDPNRGAAFYVANHPEFDVYVACPRWQTCRRRNGCVFKLDWN